MPTNGPTNEKHLVLFTIAGEKYAVDINSVYEIIRMQPVTRIPKAPFFVEGIINLRGKVVPIVDMRKRLGLGDIEQTKESRIMVVDSNGESVGIIVDAVTEVLRIPADAVEPPSNIIITTASDYMLGIAKRDGDMIVLLDLNRVLSKEDALAPVMAGKKTEQATSPAAAKTKEEEKLKATATVIEAG
jgi:purine-binding chemotaxis protein CheW